MRRFRSRWRKRVDATLAAADASNRMRPHAFLPLPPPPEMLPKRAWSLIAMLAAACGGPDAGSVAVVVDTLPGGIPRTVTAAPIESGRWSLEPVRDVGQGAEGPAELLDPASVAIADDGSVLVAERRPAQIKVYDPSGAFVRAIGRDGAGPGEFGAALLAVRGETLFVQDPGNGRASTIAWRTGEFLDARRTACCYYAGVDIDAERRAWLRMMAPLPDSGIVHGQGFIRVRLDGGATDTAFAYERPGLPAPEPWQFRSAGELQFTTPVPLSPRAHFIVEPAGGLLSGWSAEYSLRVSRTGRDTVALFGRRWTPATVSGAEKDALVEDAVRRFTSPGSPYPAAALRAAFEGARIPDRRPAYDFLHADEEGRRWVRLSDADTGRVHFDLFDRDGRWLDALEVPAALWPRQPDAPIDFGRREVAVAGEAADGRPVIRVFAIRRR